MSRIKIEGASINDFEDYYRIRCEPSDIYWMGHNSAPDYQMIFGVFSERLGSKTLLNVGDKVIYMAKDENEVAVGFAMLSLTDSGIEIGISLLEKCQGQGFGTEIISLLLPLAKEYHLPIFASIRDDNVASQRIFQKNSFEKTSFYEMKTYPKVGLMAIRRYIYNKTDCLD